MSRHDCPEKGKGLHDFRKKALGLQNNPRPFCHHRAVRCFRACMKELIEKPFYQAFILARTYFISRVCACKPRCAVTASPAYRCNP